VNLFFIAAALACALALPRRLADQAQPDQRGQPA
jgi:hypothetical protein